jgi:hypothetical protein
VSAAQVLLLAAFNLMVVQSNRMLSWYAPVYAIVLVPHLEEIRARASERLSAWRRRYSGEPGLLSAIGRPTWRWGGVCLLFLWAAFVFSPLSRPALGGQGRSEAQVLGSDKPIALAEHLRDERPEGIVYIPQVWSDFLVWAGPPGLKPMVTSNIHLVPATVWRDYLSVHEGLAGWLRVTNIYDIDHIVLARGEHRPQIGLLRRAENWRIAYEDAQAFLFERASSDAAGEQDGASDRSEIPAGSGSGVEPEGEG